MSAITNEVVWFIVVMGFFVRVFIKIGFGDRLVLFFVFIVGGMMFLFVYGF